MPVTIEEWDEAHPRWADLAACIRHESDDEHPQERWAFHSYPPGTPGSHFLVALQGNQVVGFLRFMDQQIGPPDDHAPIMHDGRALTEAKIIAFGVRADYRRRGIGTALQEDALRRAAALGCYQVRSRSDYANHANYALKVKLGFAIMPDFRTADPSGAFWVRCTRQSGQHL